MHTDSYKHFLHSIEKLPTLGNLQKLLLIAFGFLIISFGITSTLFYYQYSKEAPIRAQKAYLNTIIVQFNSIKGATDELVKNFQVAGARTNFFKDQQKTQTQEAYWTANDDLARITAQIRLARENLKTAEKTRYTKTPPGQFAALDEEIKNHNLLLFGYLDNLLTKYQVAKDITLALGPDLYSPTLTSEDLWEKQDKDEIISYYQKKLMQADSALVQFAAISPPNEFENYYNYQITYLENLVTLARDVNNILSLPDPLDAEAATGLEKAYAQVIKANKDTADLVQKILAERSNLFNTQMSLNELARIKITQNSIVGHLEYFASSYGQVKIIRLPKVVIPFFFGGLQTPSNFW